MLLTLLASGNTIFILLPTSAPYPTLTLNPALAPILNLSFSLFLELLRLRLSKFGASRFYAAK